MERRGTLRRTAAVVGVAMTALIVASAPAAATDGTTHRVHEGESIQAAIDAAEPGDKIHIEAGTYFENVYVTKDFIELEGDGTDETFLRPPAVATPNPCVEGNEIFGAVCVGLTDDPVEGFELEDMTIEGFLNGAFLVNTIGAEVEEMVFANNSEYGAFYNASTGGDFHENVAYGSGEAGLYFGDSENADVEVEDNEVYDNTFGIFIRDAANGEAEDNHAHDNCYGIFLLDTGEPFSPTGWHVDDNDVVDNTKACTLEEEGGLNFSGGGIVLGGASQNRVTDNDVDDNVPSGPSLASGGIVLFSTVDFGGGVPSNNVIDDNDLDDNQPFDINDDGTGTGNTYDDNDCDTSQPPGLCDDDGHNRGDDGDHD
jgi:parallel beta-helix repeat protein